MKLIEPKVELLSELDISPESHIARCARVCYGKEHKEPNQEADKKMVEGLMKREHLSMLRHGSMYLSHIEDIPKYLETHIFNSSYWDYNACYGYASTNVQEFMFDEIRLPRDFRKESITVIDNNRFLEECAKHSKLFELYRLTFCITTQISTSRELNRVSPNNIAERSTRYCSQKDGLVICKPWWWNDDSRRINKIRYESSINKAQLCYQGMIDDGMKLEDARGILPLDTATKVIYTYSVQEWRHIIGLRYYGTTGRPHPNARLVIGMVREQINNFAKEHNIDYKV